MVNSLAWLAHDYLDLKPIFFFLLVESHLHDKGQYLGGSLQDQYLFDDLLAFLGLLRRKIFWKRNFLFFKESTFLIYIAINILAIIHIKHTTLNRILNQSRDLLGTYQYYGVSRYSVWISNFLPRWLNSTTLRVDNWIHSMIS